jgi:hypothetical protein
MAFRDIYRKQAALLIRVLPLIAEERCFALKGGTAINLFIRDMPRLSVDVDLTYVPVAPRAESLAAIDTAMRTITARVAKTIPGAHITQAGAEGAVTRLIIQEGTVRTSPTSIFLETKFFCVNGIGIFVVTMSVASTSGGA